jgi:hypothetical protein
MFVENYLAIQSGEWFYIKPTPTTKEALHHLTFKILPNSSNNKIKHSKILNELS